MLNSASERKRTRGIQSSIASAMALKEKRSTLLEAKDIRKAKQQQIDYEYQEHQERQQSQLSKYNVLPTPKDENTALPINSISLSQKPPSKILRLDPSCNLISSSSLSNDHVLSKTDPISQIVIRPIDSENVMRKDKNNLVKREKDKDRSSSWYKGAGILESPTIHPPTKLFNEEDHNSFADEEEEAEIPMPETTKLKGKNRKWDKNSCPGIDKPFADQEQYEAEKDKYNTMELNLNDEGDDKDRSELSSVATGGDDDLVSECMMSQSRNPFPNVEDLVSELPSTALNTSLTGCSSKALPYVNGLIINPSPISSQACSSISS